MPANSSLSKIGGNSPSPDNGEIATIYEAAGLRRLVSAIFPGHFMDLKVMELFARLISEVQDKDFITGFFTIWVGTLMIVESRKVKTITPESFSVLPDGQQDFDNTNENITEEDDDEDEDVEREDTKFLSYLVDTNVIPADYEKLDREILSDMISAYLNKLYSKHSTAKDIRLSILNEINENNTRPELDEHRYEIIRLPKDTPIVEKRKLLEPGLYPRLACVTQHKSNIETLAESMALRDCNEKGEIDTLADSIQEFDMNVEMKDMKKDRPVKIDEEQLVEDFEEINIENEEFEII
ncbi:hypothetical protein O9G_004741 [Rozella allomycis CSF55]|uniref:Uncharacterized protein n=1 Tax=Rozella allomycis (strain CSF55) TaxID=988480 RepID=A0A075B156_ROZAC|nr:hypothetical protein O9G_004741 [Rozella allomycis CSF55]|eukprot:EPZ36314.1 hypothetical protein O9G_004741 [Rozella allomycis CSF55]